MRPIACLLSALLLSVTSSSLCLADAVVSPRHLENLEGANESRDWPPASRGMSIYDSSLFETGAAGPVRITSLNLRPDGRHPVGARFGFDNLKLLFAVTPRGASALSTEFGSNLASASQGPATVFDDQWIVEVVNPDPPGDDTRPFDFKIPLSAPFVFDPADGNLLVDWIFGSPLPDQASFDRDEASADQSSRWASGANPTTAGGRFSVVTQFEFEGVPEPSAIILSAAGVCCLAASRRTRR